jgi:serine/threonine protein kinase
MLRALTLTLGDASDGDAASASEGSESSEEGTMTSGEDARGRSDRLSKAVDVFSAGCVMYYAATSGQHPFGEPVGMCLFVLRSCWAIASTPKRLSELNASYLG